MKFTVTMKDPDALYEAANEAVDRSVEGVEDEDERAALINLRREKLMAFAHRWMAYGEYISVEFDTEAGTATLVKTK